MFLVQEKLILDLVLYFVFLTDMFNFFVLKAASNTHRVPSRWGRSFFKLLLKRRRCDYRLYPCECECLRLVSKTKFSPQERDIIENHSLWLHAKRGESSLSELSAWVELFSAAKQLTRVICHAIKLAWSYEPGFLQALLAGLTLTPWHTSSLKLCIGKMSARIPRGA